MAPALLGAVLGPALQLQQPDLWAPWIYLVISAAAPAACGLAAIKSRALVAWGGVFACACALAFGVCGLRAAQFAAQALDPALEGSDITVTGVVTTMPQRNELGQRFRFEADSAQMAGRSVRLPPEIQLGWYGGEGMPVVRPGEHWRFGVRLKAPHGHANPHGFDYELWLWEQGVQATGYVRADPPPARLFHGGTQPVERARQAVRTAILERVADRQAAGVLAALVVGDQNAIERADWDVFRATGVAHLMSISGLHVTMFAWAAAWLVGALWRLSTRLCLAWPAQHAALAGGVVLAAGYALFSGWGVPAQRTVWMLLAVTLLRLAGRRWPWPSVWLLACAVVVSIDPWALMQAGFWLSFVAVGVLFATDSGAASPHPERAAGRLRGVCERAKGLLREQAIVTLALSPLSLLLFGQVSVVGLMARRRLWHQFTPALAPIDEPFGTCG